MTDQMISERRLHPRYAADAVIWVRRANHADGEWIPGVLRDYSQGGLRFLIERPFPSNEKIVVEFRGTPGRTFSLTADVAWSELTVDGRYQAGCKLSTELSPQQMSIFQQFACLQTV